MTLQDALTYLTSSAAAHDARQAFIWQLKVAAGENVDVMAQALAELIELHAVPLSGLRAQLRLEQLAGMTPAERAQSSGAEWPCPDGPACMAKSK